MASRSGEKQFLRLGERDAAVAVVELE